jgi:glycosyltransferase involved in cell wall biosynthesis
LKTGISIVVCTFNGINRILDTLNSIINLESNLNLRFELLVIDNCSRDSTAEFVKHYLTITNIKIPFKIIVEAKSGLNFARITGLKNAKNDWVLLCDDDNILNKNYLTNALEIINKYPDLGAIGGKGIAKVDCDLPDWFDKYSHSFAIGPQGTQTGFLPLGSSLYGAGLFVNKKPLLMLFNTGFETIMSDRKGQSLSSGGDVEWCYLLQIMGFKLFYANELIFHHKIQKERLEWAYYEKLKSGIASGVALLEPYQSIIKNPKNGIIHFFVNYLFKAIYLNTIYAYKLLKKLFNKKYNANVEWRLGNLIIASKALSFRKNFIPSFLHFIAIKKILNAID